MKASSQRDSRKGNDQSCILAHQEKAKCGKDRSTGVFGPIAQKGKPSMQMKTIQPTQTTMVHDKEDNHKVARAKEKQSYGGATKDEATDPQPFAMV